MRSGILKTFKRDACLSDKGEETARRRSLLPHRVVTSSSTTTPSTQTDPQLVLPAQIQALSCADQQTATLLQVPSSSKNRPPPGSLHHRHHQVCGPLLGSSLWPPCPFCRRGALSIEVIHNGSIGIRYFSYLRKITHGMRNSWPCKG